MPTGNFLYDVHVFNGQTAIILGRDIKEGFPSREAFLETGNRLNIVSLNPGLYTIKIQTTESTAVQWVVKK